MRTQPDEFTGLSRNEIHRYRHVVGISFADNGTDITYLTSHSDAFVPTGTAAADRIDSALVGISSQSQRFNARTMSHSIGGVKIKLLDVGGALSAKIKAKLDAGEGLRGKEVKYWQGFAESTSWANYALRFTYVVDNVVSYKDGVYTLSCSAVTRLSKQQIFTAHLGQLASSITATDTAIPVTIANAGPGTFPTVWHDSEATDYPSQAIGYVRIEDEVIAHSGWTDANYTHLQVVARGALSTKAVAHDSGSRADVEEYIYLEMAVPKLVYALLTGVIPDAGQNLPPHWCCGIDPRFVDLDAFRNLGPDMWDSPNDGGRIARIIGEKAQNAKRFIETQLLRWLPAFLPVDAQGRIRIQRLGSVLPYGDYQAEITDSDILSFGELEERENEVINDLTVKWSWIDIGEFQSAPASVRRENCLSANT